MQLIPVGSIGSKDEFEGIKKISSQETIVAHHLLAGMSGIIPPEGALMGNPLQYNETYYENEAHAKADNGSECDFIEVATYPI
ncbi:hypothetical protein [Photobacterium profundum]|uniref:Uncharacterized protein n=1 Tax=Photobacterium profundum (strain SS9) TaxID=298386 RepID=Q6LI66_PHOPR|nr:hypothetical protein [Photobacterium profundum]CAG23014.1 hypothetical protein PBPRB1142 [Photobacterium profundum SS9]